jgi:hypothetical protein
LTATLKVMSFMTEIATVAIKTYKLSGASPISRSHLPVA